MEFFAVGEAGIIEGVEEAETAFVADEATKAAEVFGEVELLEALERGGAGAVMGVERGRQFFETAFDPCACRIEVDCLQPNLFQEIGHGGKLTMGVGGEQIEKRDRKGVAA